MPNNLLEWHFTISGLHKTPFEDGLYHGKVVLDKKYPYIAPDIYILTPNGRFKPNQKICLSATKFHQKQWQPRIKIKDILFGLRYFMGVSQSKMETMGVGSMVCSDEERVFLAKRSHFWKCECCGLSLKDIAHKFDFVSTSEDKGAGETGETGAKDAGEQRGVEKTREEATEKAPEEDRPEMEDLEEEKREQASEAGEGEEDLVGAEVSEDYLSYKTLQKKLENIDQESQVSRILDEIKEMKLVSMSITYKDHPDLVKSVIKPVPVPFKKRLKNWVENLLFIVLLVVIYMLLAHLLLEDWI